MNKLDKALRETIEHTDTSLRDFVKE